MSVFGLHAFIESFIQTHINYFSHDKLLKEVIIIVVIYLPAVQYMNKILMWTQRSIQFIVKFQIYWVILFGSMWVVRCFRILFLFQIKEPTGWSCVFSMKNITFVKVQYMYNLPYSSMICVVVRNIYSFLSYAKVYKSL